MRSPCYRAGLDCAASDLSVIHAAAPDILTAVPGIRSAGGAVHDQQHIATPAEAIRSGANILVLGRAITGATDSAYAAQAIAVEVDQAL